MFIKRVYVKGLIALSHNNILELDVTFTSPFQIIIGTNGSGKTSLMREFTPFPSNRSRYSKDGMRIIEFEDKGKEYVCIDDFANDEFTFIEDGVVVHEKSTYTMQKSITQRYFNLNQTVVDILTDKIKFTKLDANKRRSIIMEASGIDIDTGVELLNSIKKKGSYYKLHLKALNKRLVNEENSIPTDSHIENLEETRYNILHDLKIIDELATPKTDLPFSEVDLTSRLIDLKQRAKFEATVFQDTPKILYGVNDLKGAESKLLKLQFEIDRVNENKLSLTDELDELKHKLESGSFSTVKTSDIEKDIERFTMLIKDIEKDAKGFLVRVDDYDNLATTAQDFYENLRTLLSELPDNSNRYYNRERRTENTNKITEIGNRIALLNRAILNLEHQLNLHKTGDKVECPSCSSIFIPGVTTNPTALQINLDENRKMVADLERELLIEKTYQSEIAIYQNSLIDIDRMLKYNPSFYKLKEALDAYGYISNPPIGALGILTDWVKDVKASPQYNEYHKKLSEAQAKLAISKDGDLSLRLLDENRLNKLLSDYDKLIDQSTKLELEKNEVKRYIRYVESISGWNREYENLDADINSFKAAKLNNLQHEFVMDSRIELTGNLNHVEKEISDINYLKANRATLIAEKEEAIKQVHAHDILEKELSPKSGLLGDAMNGFIDTFVEKMNSIISSVWTYPLEVKPCRNAKGDLDFKFPVQVNGSNSLVDDVGGTSSAQSDIIDFAFKLLIMKAYGLMDMPLLLDELSGQMDEVHRVRMMKTIYDMVEGETCTQMFLISHYAAQHGTFTQAEVLVVNESNLLTLPEKFNDHVKIS